MFSKSADVILSLIEPAVRDLHREDVALASLAISAKRIADALEKLAGPKYSIDDRSQEQKAEFAAELARHAKG